ncbi:hypothetical protein [Pseudomonas aeruginosa]|nr:hypothetical protein [Pseudomonas aeruginosa]
MTSGLIRLHRQTVLEQQLRHFPAANPTPCMLWMLATTGFASMGSPW